MTRFLGYDPDGIDVLRKAMRRVADELATVRCDDPTAAGAVAAARATRAAIEQRWLPLLDGFAMCRVLDSYREVALTSDDLTTSTYQMLRHEQGWRIVDDPLQMPVMAHDGGVTETTARAIAWRVSSAIDARALLEAHEVAWLARALEQIAADERLAVAFAEAMSRDGWRRMADTLAGQQLWALDPINAGLLGPQDAVWSRDLDSAFTALGAIVAVGDRSVLDAMAPYSAALVVQRLGLSGSELAELAARLLRRWLDVTGPELPEWPDLVLDGPNAGDVVLSTLARDPTAVAAFAPFVIDEPALLFVTAADPRVAEGVAIAMTRPGAMPAADVGAVVVRLSTYILDDGLAAQWRRDPEAVERGRTYYRAVLGELAAPWLLQFTDWRRHEWGFDEGDGERLLARILRDDDAFARFGDARPAAVAAFEDAVDADADRAVDDLGAVSGLLDRIAYDRAMDDAHAALALWDLKVGVASFVLTALAARASAPLPPLVSKVVRRAVRRGSETGLERFARDRGWEWAPPTESDSRADAAAALSWSHTVLVGAVAAASFEQLQRSGRVAPGTPPPPPPTKDRSTLDYRRALEAWRSALPADVQAEAGLYRDLVTTYDPERPDR